jgi:DNA-binding transcriptional MerR regulator
MRLTIGEFSRFCCVTVKTLRHYEKLGLLVPNEVDEWTRYRYYDVSQMQQLNSILRLKSLGSSLEEIRDLFEEGTHNPSVPQMHAKMQAVEEEIMRLREKHRVLRKMVDNIEYISMMEHISIQRLPEIIVASHRRVLKHREDFIPLFNQVINPEIQRLGCRRTLPIYGFTMEHEQEYKSQDIDTEYCLQVEQMYEDSELIKFKRLHEVATAVCLKHLGPYDTIHESFAEVMRYIADQGLKVAGLCRMQFEEGLHNQRDPKKFITIIQVPVIKDAKDVNRLPSETYYQ